LKVVILYGVNVVNSKCCIDLINIQAKTNNKNISKISNLLSDYYKKHKLVYFTSKSSNPNINDSRIADLENTKRTLFNTNYTAGKKIKYWDGAYISQLHYYNIKFAGLSTYKSFTDNIRKYHLNNILDTLAINNQEYSITEIHIAFDIEIETNIDKFLPIKLNKATNIEDPLKPLYNTTRYIETTKEPRIKAYLYYKSEKENIRNKSLYRFEIRFRELNKLNISNNPDKIIIYIKKELDKYKLFHSKNNSKLNDIKKEYSNNIKKIAYENIPNKLLKQLSLCSTNINLILSNDVIKQIYDLFNRNNQIVKKKCYSFLIMQKNIYFITVCIICKKCILIRYLKPFNKSPPYT
jgi:hypothetical protein